MLIFLGGHHVLYDGPGRSCKQILDLSPVCIYYDHLSHRTVPYVRCSESYDRRRRKVCGHSAQSARHLRWLRDTETSTNRPIYLVWVALLYIISLCRLAFWDNILTDRRCQSYLVRVRGSTHERVQRSDNGLCTTKSCATRVRG
jgi:hypothetical protein